MAESHLDRVTDYWLYDMQNPKIAEIIHTDFWDKVYTLETRAKMYRVQWDTHPQFAEFDYHLFKFSPKYHAAMLYRIDNEKNIVYVEFVCDLREYEILTEMAEAASKLRSLGL